MIILTDFYCQNCYINTSMSNLMHFQDGMAHLFYLLKVLLLFKVFLHYYKYTSNISLNPLMFFYDSKDLSSLIQKIF